QFQKLSESSDPQSFPYVTIEYDIALARPDLISVSFFQDDYGGGAHPESLGFSVNYNARSGRWVALESLFKRDTPYLQVVRDLCVKDLSRQLAADGGASDSE